MTEGRVEVLVWTGFVAAWAIWWATIILCPIVIALQLLTLLFG